MNITLIELSIFLTSSIVIGGSIDMLLNKLGKLINKLIK